MIERRASVRYPCDLEAYCKPAGAGADSLAWMGRVRNLSVGGLRLLLSRRHEVGAWVDLELSVSVPDTPGVLRARVANITAMRYGGWALGCAFEKPLSKDEVRALLGT